MPDGKRVIMATSCIPTLVGSWTKSDISAMEKENKGRKDVKMTAKVTEDRQYRYFDHWITDSLASRLLLVNTATKEFKDLTPKWDRLFQNSGTVDSDLSPDGSQIALIINTTPPPYSGYPNNDVYLVPTDGSGMPRNVTADNPADDSGPTFSPDGRSIVFTRYRILTATVRWESCGGTTWPRATTRRSPRRSTSPSPVRSSRRMVQRYGSPPKTRAWCRCSK